MNSELFLPDGYSTNPPASADRDGTPYWQAGLTHNDVRYQVPVYRLVARRARTLAPRLVMDIGCGSGDKLAEFLSPLPTRVVGVDQESAIQIARERFPQVEWCSGDLDRDSLWDDLLQFRPELTICADVIEHLVDPVGLLARLHRLIDEGLLVLSTPDRSRLENRSALGPPGNPRHIHEWTMEELSSLVVANGFRIVDHHHLLPRRYSLTKVEVKRFVWRALHRLHVPDPSSCQVLELRRA
jgi:predicted TPR repeat methyltransferase